MIRRAILLFAVGALAGVITCMVPASGQVDTETAPFFVPKICFAEFTDVRPMIETYPLARAAEGYARMMSGKARFRVVLTM